MLRSALLLTTLVTRLGLALSVGFSMSAAATTPGISGIESERIQSGIEPELLQSDGLEACRRLSGIGGGILGGFGDDAYTVEDKLFEDGVRTSNFQEHITLAAPMREFVVHGPYRNTIVKPDNYGSNETGDLWRLTFSKVPGLKVYVGLPDLLLQGTAYRSGEAQPPPRRFFDDEQRSLPSNIF